MQELDKRVDLRRVFSSDLEDLLQLLLIVTLMRVDILPIIWECFSFGVLECLIEIMMTYLALLVEYFFMLMLRFKKSLR